MFRCGFEIDRTKHLHFSVIGSREAKGYLPRKYPLKIESKNIDLYWFNLQVEVLTLYMEILSKIQNIKFITPLEADGTNPLCGV